MFTQIAQTSQHCIAMKVLWDFAIDIHVASFHTSRGLLQVLLTSTLYEFCQKHFGASFSSTITLLHGEGCDMRYKLSCKRNSAYKFSTLLEEGWLFAGELAYAIKRDGGSTLQQKKNTSRQLALVRGGPIHFLDNNPQCPERCLT